MSLQHLRSSTANKRPVPGNMSDGQIAINTNTDSPGLFFKDSNNTLVKVGPVHVGTTAPNASPASGGTAGNSVGEQWLDTTGGTYVFKVWDGSAWRSESGTFVDVNGDVMTGALGIIAGSAGSPGLYFSGDTNTGLYSPGADQLALATGGSERLRITSAGLVGVGTSSPATNFHIGSGAGGSDLGLLLSRGANTNFFEAHDGTKNFIAGTDGSNAFVKVGSLTNDPVAIVQSNAAAIYIDTSKRVGIGTTDPRTILSVGAFASGGYNGGVYLNRGPLEYNFYEASDGTNTIILGLDKDLTVAKIGSVNSYPIGFFTGNAERARIDSSGRLLVGLSSGTPSTTVFGTAIASVLTHSRDTSTGAVAQIYGSAGEFRIIGSGNAQNTNNSYGAISDQSLKTDISDAGSQWDDIKGITVRKFKLIGTDNPQIGVVAQECELVSPGLVEDTVLEQEDGTTSTVKAVKYSVLYMKAVKALQEAMERIEQLEQRLAAAGI